MTIGGIVLCGGRSSRMGRPKAWLPFGKETLLQRAVRTLRQVVEPVVVVAAPGQDVPELPASVRVVRDEVEGKGPLAGLAAGLSALEGIVDAVYLSACDVPFLKPEFVRRVVGILLRPSRFRGGAASEASGVGFFQAAVPNVGGYLHPLAAAYLTSTLPHVRSLLAAGRLRMADLFEAAPTRVIEPHELADVDPEFASLCNLNTPGDYEAARLQLSFPTPDP